MADLSTGGLGFEDYGSTVAYGAVTMASTSCESYYNPLTSSRVYESGAIKTDKQRAMGAGARQIQQAAEYQRQYQQLLGQMNRPVFQTGQMSVSGQASVKKGSSMVDEFKSYVREYKDWIFTIAIVAVIDHFFLDGALKEKLSAALGKRLDGPGGETK